MRNDKSSYFSRVDHLSREQLIRFQEDKCSPSEELKIKKHLETCRLCTEALEGIGSMENPMQLASITRRLHNRAFRKFLLRKKIYSPLDLLTYLLIAFVLGIIIIFFLWYFRTA